MEEPLELPIPFGKGIGYLQMLGLFHSNWSAVDLHTDFAIGKFLGVTHEQAHLITSGMMFGRKGKLLADLIGRSDHPRRAALLGAFNAVRATKRDIIAHGYVASDALGVTFLERNVGGSFKAKEHGFTEADWYAFVQKFYDDAKAFADELSVTQEELNAFAKAAFSLDRKDSTSPESPTESR